MGAKGNFSVFNTIMVLLCSAYQICAQDNPVFNNILGKLTTYASLNVPEKVYLQTDKDYYTNGETIWFKTYIVNGIAHTISDKSRVVYVELIDSEQNVIAKRNIYAGFDGGSGDIALAKDIIEGSYYLRAYTNNSFALNKSGGKEGLAIKNRYLALHLIIGPHCEQICFIGQVIQPNLEIVGGSHVFHSSFGQYLRSVLGTQVLR